MGYWDEAPLPRDQIVLIATTLGDRIPDDHPVRLFQEILASVDWSAWERHYCRVAGQPAIPPMVVAGAILYGMSHGIRSSRRLEWACGNAVDFIWLVEGRSIDHSTFCKFRTRFGRELKDLFRQLGRLAMGMGLIRLNQVAPNGTRVRAKEMSNGECRIAKGETSRPPVIRHSTFVIRHSGKHLQFMPAEPARLDEQNPAPRADPTQPVAEADWAKLPRNAQTKKLDKAAFVYDRGQNCYYCPMGRKMELAQVTRDRKPCGDSIYQIYRCSECSGCPLAGACLGKNASSRTVARDQHEPSREALAARMRTPAGRKTYARRAWMAETPNALIKAWMGLRQFLLRGLDKVRIEWRWACTAYNLRKLVTIVAGLRAEVTACGG